MRNEENIEEVLETSLPSASLEEMDSAGARVLNRLRVESDQVSQAPIRPSQRQTWRLFAVAALVLLVVATAVIVRISNWSNESIAIGQAVRTNGNADAIYELPDGSRVEMRAQSELSLEPAEDGLRIRLSKGGVIVNAAKQSGGHLYVQTKDVTVSVVGTVFLVNAEEEGSRVAVLEGEVRVRQGTTERKLLPGEQVATSPSMESLPVVEEISWSRHAEAHLALLQKSILTLPPASSKPLGFEVASIKPSGPDSPPISISSSPGRFTTSNTSLRMLVTWAYDISNDRLIGAPQGSDSARYDITAKVPSKDPGEDPGRERLKVMMQTLLAERFKLAFHRETRELPTYALGVDKKGLKVVLRDAGNDLGRNTFNMPGSGRLVGTKVTTGMLAKVLSEQLHRETEDRTELKGIFDFTLEWAPESDSANTSGRPSIFTAIREQLGLELVARKGPVEVLVIERLERAPTEN